ncbi:hypothetical protein [Dyadobacter diqingensis]|uniref:hypothetical protein n=1 Tax=Dyadobacter diqingensis TaxID=2938121 RepID=UPI0020C4977D|nr:hypothetical protein [Dyadobacter diqingensis]
MKGKNVTIGTPESGLFDSVIPENDSQVRDKIAYAEYYCSKHREQTESYKKLFLNDFITHEDYGLKMTELNCDAEYLEMRSFLEKVSKI